MRFADYFGRAFSAVSAAQFPWVKMFRESSVAKIADVSWRFFYLFIFEFDNYRMDFYLFFLFSTENETITLDLSNKSSTMFLTCPKKFKTLRCVN